MRNAIIVCRKELTEVMREKKLIIPLFLVPIGNTILFSFILRRGINDPKAIQQIIGQMFPMFLILLGFFAAIFSLGIAVESFVGEKERKTIEPLLATPLSELELFVGKCLAAVSLPVVVAYVTEFLFVGIVAFQFVRADVQFTMPSGQILFIIVLMPLVALLMCLLAAIISARSSSIKSASQLTIVPIVLLMVFFQSSGAAIMRSNIRMILTVAIIAGIDVLTLYVGSRIFQREKLISSL